MKFQIGNEIDEDLCIAISHEFLRCEEAFNRFYFYAIEMVRKVKDRTVSFYAYNAYSDFIHHLYEFMVACCSRDCQNTNIADNKKRTKVIEKYINSNVQRLLNKRREYILNGTSPKWENDISYYPEKVPNEFAEEFRRYRNKTIGHASYERASKLSLSRFYNEYHKYLHLLYCDGFCWKNKNNELADLKEITDFSILIEKIPPKK